MHGAKIKQSNCITNIIQNKMAKEVKKKFADIPRDFFYQIF